MNKIDLIIDALEAKIHNLDYLELTNADLAATRKLKTLQPVGVFKYDEENKVWEELTPNCKGVKLYALDEVKHD